MAKALSTWMTDKLAAWVYAMLTMKPRPLSFALKESPRVISAATSQLVGRRADLIIIDDII